MRITIIIAFSFSILMNVAAQKAGASAKTLTVHRLISPPTIKSEYYPEEDSVLTAFLKNHIKYPQMEKDNDIQGTVKVGFFIDTNGMVIEPHIIGKAISPGLGKEAMRLVKALPKFNPAICNKKPVPYYYVLNLNFALETQK